MKKEIEILREYGCEITKTYERMLNNEDFYLECVLSVLADPDFELLGKYIEERNLKKAFDTAHGLKGITLNTGLTPLANITMEIVEILRKGSFDNVDTLYPQLINILQEINYILKK